MLVEALEPAGGVIECDRSVEIACLPMLGELALERLDAAAWQVVVRQRSRFDRQERGAEDTSFRLALSAAAYACDMDGDFDRAAAEARLAEELASTPPARALALCSRAMVARLAGEAVSHRDHVCAALALLESCKERDGFPAFATLPLDVANEAAHAGFHDAARAAFARYRAPSPAAGLMGDRRMTAHVRFTEGHVLKENGDDDLATAAFESAFSAYRSLAYTRRSIMSALHLAPLRPRDGFYEGYISLAVERLSLTSWMRRAAEENVRNRMARKLTPVQRSLIKLVCEGCTNGEIAGRRGTSQHTVRNQVAYLFEVLGVRSRAELTAVAIRQGFDTE